MKTTAMIIGAVIIILLLGAVVTSLFDFRTDEQTDEFNVTTGGGVTTADLVLSQDLYNDATVNANVSSNLTADAPIASTYTPGTNTLHVIGLQASDSRRLTIDYAIDGLTDYLGVGIAASTLPLFLVLGIIGIVAGAVYVATRGGD